MILAPTLALMALIFAKGDEPAAAIFCSVMALCAVIALWRELL